MRKRILAIVCAAIFVLCVKPQAAQAKGIGSAGTYDLSDYGDGSTITINTSAPVMITNKTEKMYHNIRIVCSSADMRLTLSNVQIENSTPELCALSFTGRGNHLTLIGTNRLESGTNQPGILVGKNDSLTIEGDGKLYAQGGQCGAGIGGGNHSAGGMLNIVDANVTATGGRSN